MNLNHSNSNHIVEFPSIRFVHFHHSVNFIFFFFFVHVQYCFQREEKELVEHYYYTLHDDDDDDYMTVDYI